LYAAATEVSLLFGLLGPYTAFSDRLIETAVDICSAAPDVAVPAVLLEIDRPFLSAIWPKTELS
jgi:hypothetical protein